MYETVTDAWIRYSALLDAAEPPGMNRSSLSAEIHTRFGQLDLILGRIVETLDVSRRSVDEMERKQFLEVWDWVAIHTDSFYFFGWRVLDLLNGEAGKAFLHLEPIVPADFLAVRDSLLDHPERQSNYYRHAMELRDEAEEKIGRAVEHLEEQT